MAEHFANFSEFYPFYLSEHQNPVSRRLHVIGSLLTLLTLSHILRRQLWRRLIVLPLIGYGFAWVGHFFFEHNKPATFSHPWYKPDGRLGDAQGRAHPQSGLLSVLPRMDGVRS